MNRLIRATALKQNRYGSLARRGVTLIEMMVVIAMLSVAFAAMGGLLHGVWRVQHAMDDHRLRLDTLERLAAQFRSDVHRAASAAIRIGGANSASISGESSEANETGPIGAQSPSGEQSATQAFTLTMPDGKQIDYQVSGGSVSRIVRDGEKVTARENYRLPAEATVKWEITSSDFNRRQSAWQASLLVSYPRSNRLTELSEKRNLRIDATAGLQTGEIRLTQAK